MASVLLTNLSIFNLVFCTTCSPSTTEVLSTLWISPTLWNTQTNNPFIELSTVNNPIDHSPSPSGGPSHIIHGDGAEDEYEPPAHQQHGASRPMKCKVASVPRKRSRSSKPTKRQTTLKAGESGYL
ncbi:hypothetical protein CHARACLAT_031077 [Characodon lateralis]|uniref:Uncharacterized protein n=1 Tax=Characodon lateralis TaxID=208331 RepID=A0ABU7D237_9TELE|nr:hypothetical protein [Characodon lateralis]